MRGTLHHWWLTLLYDLVLLAIAGYAWRSRDHTAQRGAAIVIASSALTAVAIVAAHVMLGHGKIGLWVANAVTLAALGWLMLGSDRDWTIWACGFQVAAVGLDLAALFQPPAVIRSYMLVQPVYSYLVLLALLLGSIRERQQHRSRINDERDTPAG